MKHPKAVQVMVNLDIGRLFNDYTKTHTPHVLLRTANRRGGGKRNVAKAIQHHRDRGMAILWNHEEQVWHRSNDPVTIKHRVTQQQDWNMYRPLCRQCRAVRGEYEANPTPALFAELQRIELSCITLGSMIGKLAADVLTDTMEPA